MGWGFRWRALKWLFCSGRVAFYYRNAGSLKTERWLFSSGLCSYFGIYCLVLSTVIFVLAGTRVIA